LPLYGGRGGLGHQRTVEPQFSFEDGTDVFEGHKVNFAAFVWAAKLGKDLIQVTMRTADGQSPVYCACIVEAYEDPITEPEPPVGRERARTMPSSWPGVYVPGPSTASTRFAQLSTMAASDSRPRTPNPAHAAPPH
jgi:hypothetical protein